MKHLKARIAAWYPWLAVSQLFFNIVLILVVANGFNDTKSAAWHAGHTAHTSVTNAFGNLQVQNNEHKQELLKLNAKIIRWEAKLDLALAEQKKRCSK